MMLVHKQQSPFLSNPAFAHRRHPSAPPTIIIRPTHTPGLLSLSKPPQRSNNRSPRLRQQQNILLNPAETKPAAKSKKKPKSDKLQSPPSQAEMSDSASDPFSLSFKPSLKSQVLLTTPVTSKTIPVPALPRPSKRLLSRSEPALGHNWDHIHDDCNDESPKASTTTPTCFRAASTLETPRRKTRHHKRTPSDHIFAMSSDDEAVSNPDDIRALLDFVRHGSALPASITTPARKAPKPDHVRSLSPASRERYFEIEAQNEVAGYFASSSFQNSPSPDDLPVPLFA